MENYLNDLVANLYFAIKKFKSKKILIASEYEKEGKSTFVFKCIPLLSKVFDVTVLFIDDSYGEKVGLNDFESDKVTYFPIKNQDITDEKKFYEDLVDLSDDYDLTIYKMKDQDESLVSFKKFHIDSAILVRSEKSIQSAKREMTKYLQKNEITILGIVNNQF